MVGIGPLPRWNPGHFIGTDHMDSLRKELRRLMVDIADVLNLISKGNGLLRIGIEPIAIAVRL
jgi:hypothetical protein